MIALLLAAALSQLPILPPLLPNENSKADVATLGYLAELNAFYDRVQRSQREIEAEPDEQRREVLRARLDEYQRDFVPIFDKMRQVIERMRPKERRQSDFAGLVPLRRIGQS